jgi:chemotaxis protein methyltransferase CheR
MGIQATKSASSTGTALSDAEYEFIRKLIYEQSRINLGDRKRALVSARLSKRLKARNVKSVGDYLALIRKPGEHAEIVHLIDAISTNHTFFFREQAHFEFLRSHILPNWLKARGDRGGTFRIWSAASSTGEEPYSLAIEVRDFFAGMPDCQVQMECTDISTNVLRQAEEGIFIDERVANVTPARLKKYFQRGTGSYTGKVRVRDEVRRGLRFQRLNLLQAQYPFREAFDLICCRNVMIYFDKPTQQELIAKMKPLIKPGGHLFIGHSESLSGYNHGLRSVQPAIYRQP